MNQFELAKDKIMMGAERRSMVMSEAEKRNTAYHEQVTLSSVGGCLNTILFIRSRLFRAVGRWA